jgi:Arc-like DNA binding domain
MSDQINPYPLRLDLELKRWLQERAAANQRRLNGEIIVRLEESRKMELEKASHE